MGQRLKRQLRSGYTVPLGPHRPFVDHREKACSVSVNSRSRYDSDPCSVTICVVNVGARGRDRESPEDG